MPDSPPPREIEQLAPWIAFDFDRGGGPGGQNVNKVSTRAILLFDFAQCPLFTLQQRDRIRARLARRLSADGKLRIVSQSERSQLANRRHAEERLLRLLAEATYQDAPRTPTRPTRGSQRRRVHEKRLRGDTKRSRGAPRRDAD